MAKIGIIRGLLPRVTQAEFANSFKKIEPIFITGSASSEVREYCKKVGLKNVDLPVKKTWSFDPTIFVPGSQAHHRLKIPSRLYEACLGQDVLETYEAYHLFSGEAVEVARKLNIPLVCEVWTSFRHPAYFVPPYSINTKKVIRAASLFIARSKRAKSTLLRLGVDDEKIRVIYHGVNIKKFKIKYKSRKNSKKLVILCVGEMEEYKGVDDLLKVWPQIYEKYKNVNLWLVGKGSLTNSANKIAGVKVWGYVAHSQLPEVYRQADIFVSPSKNRHFGPFLWWEEFFSYTLMEAQASGLPIIGSDSGGIPEEIGGKNLIVKQGDKEGLKKALIMLIENKSLRESLSLGNRGRAERLFNLQKNTQKLEDEIVKIL